MTENKRSTYPLEEVIFGFVSITANLGSTSGILIYVVWVAVRTDGIECEVHEVVRYLSTAYATESV